VHASDPYDCLPRQVNSLIADTSVPITTRQKQSADRSQACLPKVTIHRYIEPRNGHTQDRDTVHSDLTLNLI